MLFGSASQVVARSQMNSACDHQIPSANSVDTSNGRNQITAVSGTGGASLGWGDDGDTDHSAIWPRVSSR